MLRTLGVKELSSPGDLLMHSVVVGSQDLRDLKLDQGPAEIAVVDV